MNITKLSTITAALSASLLLNAPSLKAQDAPAATPAPSVAATPAPAAPAAGGGNQDWRQRMADRLKTELKVTDDKEWAVIQPLIEKVTEKQQTFGQHRGKPIV